MQLFICIHRNFGASALGFYDDSQNDAFMFVLQNLNSCVSAFHLRFSWLFGNLLKHMFVHSLKMCWKVFEVFGERTFDKRAVTILHFVAVWRDRPNLADQKFEIKIQLEQ